MATDYCSTAALCYKFLDGSGTVTDSSGNGRTGTFVNATWDSSKPTAKSTGYSVLMDSSNDYITQTTSRIMTAPSAMSACMWGNISNPQPSTFAGRLVSERDGGGWLFAVGTNNIIRFLWIGSTGLSRISNNNAITINTWQHYAVTYDGSNTAANAVIYIDATPLSSYATTTNGSTLSNADGVTRFGQDGKLYGANDPTTQVYMRQTDVGIFTSQLDSTDISTIYTYGIDGTYGASSRVISVLGTGVYGNIIFN